LGLGRLVAAQCHLVRLKVSAHSATITNIMAVPFSRSTEEVSYPEFSDLWLPLPMALIVILLRSFLEK